MYALVVDIHFLVFKVRDANSGLICDPIKSSNIPYFNLNINVYLYFLLKTLDLHKCFLNIFFSLNKLLQLNLF
jgi:hypothetical protein